MTSRRDTHLGPPTSLATRLVGGPRGAALLITGGIGAGKTTLARRLAALGPATSSLFLSVRPGAGASLWLGRELLRLLGELSGGDIARPADTAQAVRQMRQLLTTRRFAERALLVVDDVQLADPASAEVLAEFFQAPGEQRPRLALTATADWRQRLPGELATALAGLSGHTLPKLTLPGIIAQTAEVVGFVPADPMAADLLAATGGNPAALHGVLDDALAHGAVVVLDERAWLRPGHRLALPADHALPYRVDELPGAAARIAEQLAIAGPAPAAELAVALKIEVTDVEQALAALRTVGVLTELTPAIPVLGDALCARVPPWQRAAAQADVLAGRPDTGLTGLARHVTTRGRPLRPAELRALTRDDAADAATLEAVAAEMLPWCGPTPAEDIVGAAIRHWARVGDWAAIAALPADAVPAACAVPRLRAVLLHSGRVDALSDVEKIGPALAEDERTRLRSEMLGFGAELAIHVDPPDQPELAVDDSAWVAWTHGDWDEVLELAVADRLARRGAHALSTAEESAAFAADVWLRRGRPELARRWLDDAPEPPDEAGLRPLTEWARAGFDLLLRPQAAAERMATTLTWMNDNQQYRHRSLLIVRQAIALGALGRLDQATECLAELADDRLPWLLGTVGLAEYGAPPVEEELLTEYVTLAQAQDTPFELAAAQLALGTRTGDTDLVLAAVAGFGELGAALWQIRALAVAEELGVEPLPQKANSDDMIGDLVAVGLSNADIARMLLRTEMYVKRHVSRLLKATNSRKRTELITLIRQRVVPRAPERPPADPVRALLSAGPVAVVAGPTGGLAARLRKALGDTAIVLRITGWMAHREPGGLAAVVAHRLEMALPGTSAPVRAALPGGDRIAVADAVVGALRTAAKVRPVMVLLDDADALSEEDRVQAAMLAAAADDRFRVVLAASRPWPELTDLTGPTVRPPAWGPAETASAIALRVGPIEQSTAELVCARTAGDPGAVLALLRTPINPADPATALRTAVLDPAASPLREAVGPDVRCAALLAALGAPRLPVALPAFAAAGLGSDVVFGVVDRLLDNGLLASTSDGKLAFRVPLFAESLTAAADAGQVRAAHRVLAEALLAERERELPVEYEDLAEHIVGAGAGLGQPELVGFAERVAPGDAARAQRWCAALLTAEPVDAELAGRAAAVSARALYDLARFPEAVGVARRALDLAPADTDTVDIRTTLINSLLRIGNYETVMDLATDDGDTPRSVPDGLQQARILLLRQQFDDALGVLSGLRPTDHEQHVALMTGVRMLAAIGADGGEWRRAEELADPDLSPLSGEQVDAVREALAWGNLYSAERAVMPGSRPSPAARRRPPPSLARLSSAVDALRAGEWPEVLALTDENAAAGSERTYVDGLMPALAAEVLVRQGKLDAAAACLDGISYDQPFGHLVGWSHGGLRMARGEAEAAAEDLAELDRHLRLKGYLTGRELVLGRQVDALLAAGDRSGARLLSRELGALANRVNTRQATLYWLVSSLATRLDESVARSALHVAEDYGDRFLLARVRLHAAELSGADDELREAHAEFRALGAVEWQRRAAGMLGERGRSTRVTSTISATDRRLIELIAAGVTNRAAAADLGVGEKAIEARLTRLYRKTGLKSRAELVREFGGGSPD